MLIPSLTNGYDLGILLRTATYGKIPIPNLDLEFEILKSKCHEQYNIMPMRIGSLHMATDLHHHHDWTIKIDLSSAAL